MKLILFASLLVCNISTKSQDTTVYEQIALDYFIDSLMSREIPKKTKLYIVEKINDRSSVLMTSKFYKDEPDSILFNEMVKSQAKLRSLNVAKYTLRYKLELNKLRYIRANKVSAADPDITLEVHRRNIYRPGKYIVELVVRPSSRRDHFFFEIDSKLKTIRRWVVIRHKTVRSTYGFKSLPY